jgi:hypothetical protein
VVTLSLFFHHAYQAYPTHLVFFVAQISDLIICSKSF